jgi:hypothetical protein
MGSKRSTGPEIRFIVFFVAFAILLGMAPLVSSFHISRGVMASILIGLCFLGFAFKWVLMLRLGNQREDETQQMRQRIINSMKAKND